MVAALIGKNDDISSRLPRCFGNRPRAQRDRSALLNLFYCLQAEKQYSRMTELIWDQQFEY